MASFLQDLVAKHSKADKSTSASSPADETTFLKVASGAAASSTTTKHSAAKQIKDGARKIRANAAAVASNTTTAASSRAKQIKHNAIKIKDNLVEVNRENPSSYRTWKAAAGLLMLTTSVFDAVVSLVHGDFRRLVLAAYTFFFAVLICLVEARVFLLPEAWKRRMHHLFALLDRTWGRGVYFCFVGVLQATQGRGLADVLSGGFAATVGLLCLTTAYYTDLKLKTLHESIEGGSVSLRSDLVVDFSVGGIVSRSHLRHFCATQGIAVSSHELEAAYCTLDADRDGQVSVDEFCVWYENYIANNNTNDRMYDSPTLIV